MKYSFNFIQIANWLIACRESLNKISEHVLQKDMTKEEVIKLLEKEKHKIQLLKDVLNKQGSLIGVQPKFIKNLKDIKNEYLK